MRSVLIIFNVCFSIDYFVVALNGSDYATLSLNHTFVDGSQNGTTFCVEIYILDDEAFETTEIFTLELTTLDSSVRLGSNALISIIDNDGTLCKCHGSYQAL